VKRTVVLCGPSLDSVSGVATHLMQLFESTLARQYTLVQFQVGSEGRSERAIAKIARLFTSPLHLFALILRARPDIIHLNSSLEPKAYWRDLAYLLVAKVMGCKVVYQVHGGSLPDLFLGTNRFAQSFLRWSLNLPDVVVLLAEVELDAYRKFNAGKRLAVIPNAIALSEYQTAYPKNFEALPIQLGSIGRLADDKGVMETILALAILRESGANWFKLRIAGSGPYESTLRKAVEEHDMGAVVQFVGPIFGKEKMDFWREIKIFVFPTFHREGLPYTILESIASGTPLITTRVGGIPDVVADGVHGLLLDSHEPQTIADAIRTIALDTERLQKMSEAAIERAQENYSVQRLSNQFHLLYRELLS